MHELQKTVRVRVGDVVLKTGVVGLVEEAALRLVQANTSTRGYSPKVKIIHAELAILDLDITVARRCLQLETVELTVGRGLGC